MRSLGIIPEEELGLENVKFLKNAAKIGIPIQNGGLPVALWVWVLEAFLCVLS